MLEDIDLVELTEINGDLEASRSVLIDLHVDEPARKESYAITSI